MTGDATQRRWLIIVRRDRPRLHDALRDSVLSAGRVAVLLDRRAEGWEDEPADQRRHPRSPLTDAQRILWEDAGLLVVDLRRFEPGAPPEPA